MFRFERSHIDKLFGRFFILYGRKFTFDSVQEQEIHKQQWLDEMNLAGLSVAQVQAAMQVIRNDPEFSDWPPTLIRFIQLCKCPVSPDQLYEQAKAGDYSNDIARMAFQMIGTFDWHTMREVDRKATFLRILPVAYKRVLEGRWQQEPPRIEPPKPKTYSRTESAHARRQFLRLLGKDETHVQAEYERIAGNGV